MTSGSPLNQRALTLKALVLVSEKFALFVKKNKKLETKTFSKPHSANRLCDVAHYRVRNKNILTLTVAEVNIVMQYRIFQRVLSNLLQCSSMPSYAQIAVLSDITTKHKKILYMLTQKL